MIDFTPVVDKQLKMLEYCQNFTRGQVRESLNESVDNLLSFLEGANDADVVFLPYDSEADDPYAADDQKNVGWSVAHIILHATASTEEYASVGSVLGRGIEFEGRLRYEPDWQTVTTVAELKQRLEESRKMRLAYFDALPDTPNEDVYRKIGERYIEQFGQTSWKVSYLLGLMHEVGHYEQIKEAKRQAQEARQSA